ncbi:MAG: MATE family efflux transporter [Eubacteriaceae bacterium]|nr:MATE family efflux transporter [Eubacteriaceae bacterium]
MSSSEKKKNMVLYLDSVKNNDEYDMSDLRPAKHKPEDVDTKGVLSDIFRIAWPAFVELTLVQLVSMVDMMMVGSLGSYAISAVGLTTQPKMLIMNIFMAMNVGGMALIARARGMQDQERAKAIMRQAITMCAILSLIACIPAFIWCREFLTFISISKKSAIDAHTLTEAINYFRIQIVGIPVVAITSAITSSLRGIGQTRISMIYNMTANVVNVFFNYCLILGNFGFPAMGVTGASLATVIGQTTGFVFAMIVITRKNQYLRFRLRDGMKPDPEILKNIAKIGIPTVIEQLAMRLGNILYNRTISTLGTDAYATHQICFNLNSMTFMIGQAIATPSTSMVGQSIGKKRLDVADYYGKIAKRFGICIAFGVACFFFFKGSLLASLYSDDPNIIASCTGILKLIAPLILLITMQQIDGGILRGAGDTRYTAMVILFTTTFLRAFFAWFFVTRMGFGLQGAWYGFIIDQTVRSLLINLRYRSGKWKKTAIGIKMS